ncbi:hypothetical protein Droror1_Dr00005733 [Drosera rotundifolia]
MAVEEKRSFSTPLILASEKGEQENGSGFSKEEILQEVKRQLKLAGPLILVNVLIFSLQIISVMLVGHLGELPLAGASMATSFASVTGFSLLTGVSGALDTFCGQAYGAKQYRMLGIYMQRSMLVLLLLCIPLAFVWANTGNILLFLGQDPEISAEAGLYARFMIPSIFAFALLQCLIRFLQAQNNIGPMMITTGITTLLHLLNCYVMVFKSGLGNKGAAVAIATSYWINVLLLAIYVKVSPSCRRTWTGFSKEALHDVQQFIRLALPSAIMQCLETWTFEMMVLLSGLLPNPILETSVLSISLNVLATIYMIPLGLGGAISIRVSNELGAGRPHAARLAVYVAVVVVATEGILAGSTLIIGHDFWGYCYSREEKVVKYVGQVMLITAGSHFIDGIQTVLSGTARGCGRQKIGAFVNLGAYYLVGIPCAVLLAFHYHLGGKGLWIGITAALVVQASLFIVVTLRTDWEMEGKKASYRVQDSTVN